MKLPLTVVEAVKWLYRGHAVQLVCAASPWPAAVADDDPKAAHFKRRSFAATSGSMPARVMVMLVANIVGPCPNLLTDLRCGIYEDRPLVCRIYPAEINPFIPLEPMKKACPPEAWEANLPVLQRYGAIMHDATLQDIQRSRDADTFDADVKRRLCVALNVFDAAPVHEAVLVYSPSAAMLLSALAFAIATESGSQAPAHWRFVSNRSGTVESLAAHGGVAVHLGGEMTTPYQYVSRERRALFGPYPGDLLVEE